MRYSYQFVNLKESHRERFKAKHVVEHEIAIEKLNLEVAVILGNDHACNCCKHKIVDGKIFLLRLSGDLPL